MYNPCLFPLLPGSGAISTEIDYEKQLMTPDNVWHDEDHLHDFYEIYVNLSGDVSFRVEDQIYDIRRGDIILTSPNKLHRCMYHNEGFHEHFCIWINGLPFSDDILKSRFAQESHIILSDKDKETLIEHCFGLYESRQAENVLRFRAAKHLFGILDLICNGGRVSTSAKDLPGQFSEILLYISRHFHEPNFNVSSLGQRFFISNSTLNRHFTTYFQTSPSQYIEACRFAEAKKLLRIGLSVQETGLRCGFSDCPYFVKRFHKKFGITPLQYRKQCQRELQE